jgi:hypothetical protein
MCWYAIQIEYITLFVNAFYLNRLYNYFDLNKQIQIHVIVNCVIKNRMLSWPKKKDSDVMSLLVDFTFGDWSVGAADQIYICGH